MEQPLLSEQRSELAEKENGKWSSYQYVGRTGSAIPTSSLAGTEVSVDEIRSADAASSAGLYPPSLHGALVGSPEPDLAVQALVYQAGYGGDYGGPRPEFRSGLEIWRIENFNPIPIPQSSYGKFFTGDSYVILKTTSSKSGALGHDIHYWLGKDTNQDEAGAAAIKTVKLDAALGGRVVQYREVQGHETEKFLSYFKPCIIPLEGGAASGFKHVEAKEHKIRLFICKVKHVVNVKEASLLLFL